MKQMGTEATIIAVYNLLIDPVTKRSVLDNNASCAFYPGFTELMAQ